jgi:uncharacterized protein (TIGR03118 family)
MSLNPRFWYGRPKIAGALKCFAFATALAAPIVNATPAPDEVGAPLGGTATAKKGGSDSYLATSLVTTAKDPHLVNAWGIAFNPNGFVWVANGGTGTSTLYDGKGNLAPPPPSGPLVVTIPAPAGQAESKPTGIVYNSSSDFAIKKGKDSFPSLFIFATETGIIAGWNPSVNQNKAVTRVNNSGAGAIYKGLALGSNGSGHFLYATDFHNGHIDVFDATFKSVTLPAGAFTDPRIPAGFAPFGIQNLNGNLYVTYAQQDANKEDDVAGPGLGYVRIYDTKGKLIRRLISRGKLNAPWGIAFAPANFGEHSNHLLIGNFGDGKINAFELESGVPKGTLSKKSSSGVVAPIRIDGLWGLSFGNGVKDQPIETLFFTAGPKGETEGLYGKINAVPDK